MSRLLTFFSAVKCPQDVKLVLSLQRPEDKPIYIYNTIKILLEILPFWSFQDTAHNPLPDMRVSVSFENSGEKCKRTENSNFAESK